MFFLMSCYNADAEVSKEKKACTISCQRAGNISFDCHKDMLDIKAQVAYKPSFEPDFVCSL